MPVIINDFEITVEAPPKDKAQSTPTEAHAAPPRPLRPEEIARIERHYQERKKRIKAD